jgi:hypothetical protein
MIALAPHTKERLLAVSPDLADVTLRENSLSTVSLYPDCNMAKAFQFE